eukprot:m.356729 g.356729  ORF g.356729 m.356729 type:complete len:90 (-) comp19933_c0_seq2:363-632(-)
MRGRLQAMKLAAGRPVKPRRNRGAAVTVCAAEMNALMNCWKRSGFDDGASSCAPLTAKFLACVATSQKAAKSAKKSTFAYEMSKLNRPK